MKPVISSSASELGVAVGPDEAGRAGGGSPCVSVIMIFLNAEPFIAQAIESVVRQGYSDWELILVDDGSTDRSSDIARGFHQRRSDRIRYFEHPAHANLGTAASRNLGLEQARGEFVAFLDADDLYLPQRLERHVRILQQMPEIAMVQSDHVRWHTWVAARRDHGMFLHRLWPSLGDAILRPTQGLVLILAVPYLLPGICDVTVRRSVALAVGGFEGRFRVLFEDQSFVSKVMLEHTVYVLQAMDAVYRRHAASSTMRADARWVRPVDQDLSGDAFRRWLRAYVEAKPVRSPTLREVLAESSRPAGTAGAILRRLVRRATGLFRAWALTLGAAGVYRWTIEQEHRRTLDRAKAQYLRVCADFADRLIRQAQAR